MVMFLLLTRPDQISTYFKQHDVIAIFYMPKIWMFVALDSVSHGITDFLEIVGAENNGDIPECPEKNLSWRNEWMNESEKIKWTHLL